MAAKKKTKSTPDTDKRGGEGGKKGAGAQASELDSPPKNLLQRTDDKADPAHRYAWTCPTCGFVGRWRPFDKKNPVPQRVLAIGEQHHDKKASTEACAYPGGWWQWDDATGWKELGRLPVLHVVGDGIEVEDQAGKFLGHLPGFNEESWRLHLIRATDPLYPSLMDDEMKWLAQVSSDEEELHRSSATMLLGRYTGALRNMERHLVELFDRTKNRSLRREIAATLRRLYDEIRHHAIEAKSEPSPTSDRGVAAGRYRVYHSDEAKDSLRFEKRAKELVSEVLGNAGARKRPLNAECERWVKQHMYSVWDIVQGVHLGRPDPKWKEQTELLCGAVPADQIRWQGLTFPDLWKAWLRTYLREQWEHKRPKIGNRTHTFESQEKAVLFAAAKFWVHELHYIEPEHRQAMIELIKKRKRRTSK